MVVPLDPLVQGKVPEVPTGVAADQTPYRPPHLSTNELLGSRKQRQRAAAGTQRLPGYISHTLVTFFVHFRHHNTKSAPTRLQSVAAVFI